MMRSHIGAKKQEVIIKIKDQPSKNKSRKKQINQLLAKIRLSSILIICEKQKKNFEKKKVLEILLTVIFFIQNWKAFESTFTSF